MTGSLWIPVRDGDLRAYGLFQRHYSAGKNGASRNHQITGPGEHLILLTLGSDALFAWVHNTIDRADGQTGVNCAVFRNEGATLSSELVRDACEWAWAKWPGERLFKMAGRRACGRNKDGRLTLLEIEP